MLNFQQVRSINRGYRVVSATALLLAALSNLGTAMQPPQPTGASRMPPPGWVSSPKQFDAIKTESDLMIATRDGKRMATDIYRPGRNGVPVVDRFPVLLNRTPYNKTALEEQAVFYAERGYVVALQDTRGRYKSEGVFSKVQPADATDGYDVVEWLAKQPYSNGRVGMWGTSFSAHTAAGAAQYRPPALRSLLINMGGMSNAWDHGVRFRGAYEMGRQLTWAWGQLLADAPSEDIKALLRKERVEDWYSVQPLRRGLNPLSVSEEYEGWYFDFLEHADYDDYWKDPMMSWDEHYPETADIPMMHVGGWYDIFLAGTFKNFAELRKQKRAPQRIVVGPWTHGGNNRSFAGDVAFGDSAAIPDFLTDFHIRWFDHFLKDVPNRVQNESPVRLFVMGTGDGHKDQDGRLFHGGYWRNESQWPLAGTRNVPYYFHANGTLTATAPSASLPANQWHTTYTFDPWHPVPTIGGGSSARLKDGAYNQREDERFPPSQAPWLPLRARPDVVVFQTEPLTEDLTVIGPITVVVYASATTVDTDLTAKLIDVYPSSDDWPGGFDMNLTDAIVRARYRATRDHAELLTPGTVYPFTIEPFPTANVFKKGHRIRVDISSSNFPRFDVNPNTGEPLGKSRRMMPSDISIQHSATYPSHILLPVAPARR